MFIKLLTCLDISKRQLVGLFFLKGIVISLQYIIFTLKKHMTQALFTKQRTLKIYMRCT